MKKTVWLAAACFCVALIAFSGNVAQGIRQAFLLCTDVLIPSVFPFMALTCIAGAASATGNSGKVGRFFSKVFCIPASTVGVWAFSMLGGYPVGASMSAQLLERGEITAPQSKTLTLICFNAGPAFVINALGMGMLGSKKAGAVVFAGVCTAAVLTGAVAGRIYKPDLRVGKTVNNTNADGMAQAVVQGVYTAGRNMLGICAWVLFFSALISLVLMFPVKKEVQDVAVMLLEITQGCARGAAGLSLPAVAAFVSFGGVCVLCQVLSIAQRSAVKLSEILITRAFSAAVAYAVTGALLKIFPVEAAVNVNASFDTVMPYSHSVASAVMLMILCVILIFDLDTKQKV
ncbi:MAG: hypothetical protein IJC37_07020 [Clostridia bacterium]|nr:hypothetical protein [Clostridia bacterium]